MTQQQFFSDNKQSIKVRVHGVVRTIKNMENGVEFLFSYQIQQAVGDGDTLQVRRGFPSLPKFGFAFLFRYGFPGRFLPCKCRKMPTQMPGAERGKIIDAYI